MDERRWVVIEGCDERHVLVGNPHTHPGRMAVECPRHGRTRISLHEVVEASELARAWIDGFLSGSEPRPEDMFGDGIHLLDDTRHPRWDRWRAAVAEYRRTGDWPHERWVLLGPAHDLPPDAWTLRGDEVWQWDGARFGAVLVGLGGDTLELAVRRPPTASLGIAAEHFAVSFDNVAQGPGTIRAYAEHLAAEPHRWSFWWD